MVEKNAILSFPKELIDRPFVSKLIKERNVEINILQAYITPQEAGQLFAIFKGSASDIEEALDYLRQNNVKVILPVQNLVWDAEKCVHCGGCTGQCTTGALSINPETFEVHYDGGHCIACKLCIPACSYGALESISDHLRKTGEL
jgi:L-aspartate semialdehyde sulfurtransferase ferredoxin